MAKRKATAWNREFGRIAKECFKSTETMGRASGGSPSAYGSCMKTELKAAQKKRRGGSVIANRLKGMAAMRSRRAGVSKPVNRIAAVPAQRSTAANRLRGMAAMRSAANKGKTKGNKGRKK